MKCFDITTACHMTDSIRFWSFRKKMSNQHYFNGKDLKKKKRLDGRSGKVFVELFEENEGEDGMRTKTKEIRSESFPE